jgi:hypothetical protein
MNACWPRASTLNKIFIKANTSQSGIKFLLCLLFSIYLKILIIQKWYNFHNFVINYPFHVEFERNIIYIMIKSISYKVMQISLSQNCWGVLRRMILWYVLQFGL